MFFLLGLTDQQLVRLYRFRRVAFFFLHNSMISIPFFGPACVIVLYLRTPLYSTHLPISIIWTIILVYWIYSISALLYSNLIAFVIVAKYLHIKQTSIASCIMKSLLQLQQCQSKVAMWNRHGTTMILRFMEHNIRYNHLQDELQDYNRFWKTYITFIFVIYVVLIGFILFIIMLSQFFTLGKFTYAIVLYVNGSILIAIIYYGGQIVTTHESLSRSYTSLLGHFFHSLVPLPAYNAIKVLIVWQIIYFYLQIYFAQDYQHGHVPERHKVGLFTAQWLCYYIWHFAIGKQINLLTMLTTCFLFKLIVNISMYFILIVKKIMY